MPADIKQTLFASLVNQYPNLFFIPDGYTDTPDSRLMHFQFIFTVVYLAKDGC